MGNLRIVLAVYALAIAIPMIHGLTLGPDIVETWFKKPDYKKEKVAKFHFVFHGTITGKNPTNFQVALANVTSTSPTFFGLLSIIDDPLKVEPEPSSKTVARAQGIRGAVGLSEIDILMNLNIVFTEGKYNGSTLSLKGWNPIFNKYREMAIVGGSGVFHLARGIAAARTYFFNTTTGNAIVEYHVIVIHY